MCGVHVSADMYNEYCIEVCVVCGVHVLADMYNEYCIGPGGVCCVRCTCVSRHAQ